MLLPQLHLRLTLELNIGLEIPHKIGLPLTGLPNTVEQLLLLLVANKVELLHMAHLPVWILMALVPLAQLDLLHILLEMELQFRWLP
jgi:hypothetical protein